MCARNLGTRLNDRHNFKQPLPHLRDRMTVMCVLSKISGIRDKIQVTDTLHFIEKIEEERGITPRKRGKEPVQGYDDTNNTDLFKWNKNYHCTDRESGDDEELAIEVGLERTEMKNIREKSHGTRIVHHFENKSVMSQSMVQPRYPHALGPQQPNDADSELKANNKGLIFDRYISFHSSRDQPPPRVPPKREPSRDSGGIGPPLQHWESMIVGTGIAEMKGTRPTNFKYPRDEMRLRNDNAVDKIEIVQESSDSNEVVLNSKFSQFPSNQLLSVGEYYMATSHGDSIDDDSNYNRGCKARVAMATEKEITETGAEMETEEPQVTGHRCNSQQPYRWKNRRSRFKKMALELFDVFIAKKKHPEDILSPTNTGNMASHSPSDATKVKTLYQRIPKNLRGG